MVLTILDGLSGVTMLLPRASTGRSLSADASWSDAVSEGMLVAEEES